MALGGLGVSLAGFVGIITALDRRVDARSPVSLWRVRNIVGAGFTLTIIGFGIVAVYAATGDNAALTIRIASAVAILLILVRLRAEFGRSPAWSNDRSRRIAIGMEALGAAGFAVTLVNGNVGLFQLLLIYQLGFPLSIFYNTIRDAAGSAATS